MKNILIPFEIGAEQNWIGDCRSRSFSQLSSFYGERIPEYILFGLGYGLRFQYETFDIHNIPVIFLTGRDEEAEMIAFRERGYTVQKKEYDNGSRSNVEPDEEIIQCLQSNRPVPIECNIADLPFLPWEKTDDNPRHIILLTGYNFEEKKFTVFEPMTLQIEELSLEELLYVHRETSIHNKGKMYWYDVCPPEELLPLSEKMIQDSFIHLIDVFQDREENLQNQRELLQFLKNIYKKSKEGSKNNREYLQLIVQANIGHIRKHDEYGGAFFRGMYDKYLVYIQENYSIDLSECLEKLRISQQDWRKISFKLRYLKDDSMEVEKLFIEYLEDILSDEVKFIDSLKSVVAMK